MGGGYLLTGSMAEGVAGGHECLGGSLGRIVSQDLTEALDERSTLNPQHPFHPRAGGGAWGSASCIRDRRASAVGACAS